MNRTHLRKRTDIALWTILILSVGVCTAFGQDRIVSTAHDDLPAVRDRKSLSAHPRVAAARSELAAQAVGATDKTDSVAVGDSAADDSRRRTAVTLNYCRAALHRIRRAPGKSVMLEEQQRILNNLDLNQIDDPEVITLYRSILDEIGQVEISDRERVVIEEQFRRGAQRKMGTDIFVIGAQAVTGQVGSVIQTGANSWWDYRNTQVKRDSELWQVEKTQFSTFMTRSSTFLDSFWKLSRKNEIPDKWLLRDQDLDQLADVLEEKDGERRLRMLARMERFMECYPPYWYYVARTQQQLGRLEDAALTYERLTSLGQGHFRQDDMLAGSMANLALIQNGNHDPRAVETAMASIGFSNRNWEANLVCAWVLGRHGKYDSAEDLILCNLDEDLETEQSSVALVSLYYHSEDRARLAQLLEDDLLLTRVPVPGLLLCARLLGPNRLPTQAQAFLSSTLLATRRQSGRGNAISVAAAAGWKLSDAEAQISDGLQIFHTAGHRPTPHGVEMNFTTALDTKSDGGMGESLKMTLRYPATPTIHVVLAAGPEPADSGTSSRRVPLFGNTFSGLSGGLPAVKSYRISEIEVDGVRLSFRDSGTDVPADLDADGQIRVLKPEFSVDGSVTRS